MRRLVSIGVMVTLVTAAFYAVMSRSGESAEGFLTSQPPDAPELAAPSDGSTGLGHPVTLSWRSRAHSASYTIQVATSPDFVDPIGGQDGLPDTSFVLETLEGNTTYYWHVRGLNRAGDGEFSETWSFTTESGTGSETNARPLPDRFDLLPAYPNPFNPSTTITWLLPDAVDISLVVFDGVGREVRNLAADHLPAGTHRVVWDGRDNRGSPVSSGMYLVRLTTTGQTFTQRLVLVR